jgi:vacuolar-type H+-ATPase subunit B/Vma2
MKDFRIGPEEWRRLSRFEKRALHYHRIMEQYYMDKHYEKIRKEQEREQKKRELINKLPRVQMPRRR